MSEPSSSKNNAPLIGGVVLFLLWLGVNVGDRLWLHFDQSIPGWDEANHLTGSLNYLAAAFQFPGWEDFWRVSNKFPPLTYLLAVPFQIFFGKGSDQALLVNVVLSALLVWAVYGIGKRLFNAEVATWSAAIALLMPRFVDYRLHFITDIALTTLTLLSFACLTQWYFAERRKTQWGWALGFGCCLGLSLMTKQTSLLFLFFPCLWAIASSLWQKKWEKILQLFSAGLISIPLWIGWYRTNVIHLFSTYERANVTSAMNEGDPAVNTLKAWLYYWQDLPKALSWLLLLVPLVGICLHLLKRFPQRKTTYALPTKQSFIWLGVYFFGAYLLFSALHHKESRYIMPYLPVVGIFLGYGLTQWRGRWLAVRWATLLTVIVMAAGRLFPLPGLVQILPPQNAPDTQQYPHAQVIDTMIQADPYVRSNVGVIPSLFWLNHNNINYFGALRDFQVYGRELGGRWEQVAQDAVGFDWLLTKTGENDHANPDQLRLAELLPKKAEFYVQNTWRLPDDTELSLYRRQRPLVTVAHFGSVPQPVRLERVKVAPQAIAGQPLAIRYNWSGRWRDLKEGIALLTWTNGEQFWIQDHGFGFGMLHDGQLSAATEGDTFGIVEQTAMLPPADLPAGNYELQALYLNTRTGEVQPIEHRPIEVQIAAATAPTALEPLQLVQLDWLTQERAIAKNLPLGLAGLDPVFAQVERLNQYDPEQNYLRQVEQSLDYRLQHDTGVSATQIKDWYYAKAFAHVLQEDANGAIATLEPLSKLDPENPFVHAYLAFVYLYTGQAKQAELAIQSSLKLAPNIPELQAIDGAAALFQGKIFKVWSVVQTLRQQGII